MQESNTNHTWKSDFSSVPSQPQVHDVQERRRTVQQDQSSSGESKSDRRERHFDCRSNAIQSSRRASRRPTLSPTFRGLHVNVQVHVDEHDDQHDDSADDAFHATTGPTCDGRGREHRVRVEP